MTDSYYEDDHVVIYHGDCKELLPDLVFDVVVTDPPYGVAYVSNFAKGGPSKPIQGDEDTDLRDKVLELCGDVPMLVFGTWEMPRPDKTRHVLVWNKGLSPSLGNLSLVWGNSYEEIYVIGEGWTGKRRSNVYSVEKLSPTNKERPKHPTPKPVPLMKQLLERCPEGVIVDPFMGSGTTLRAAKDLGRKAIGIEIEEKYCEIAAKRMAQEVLPI